VIGLLGGVVGTYFSIKNTSGPRELAFAVRVAVVAWIGILAFLIGLLTLPRPFNFLLWVPYVIALPIAIMWSNRRQRNIRSQEATSRAASRTAS
jgi:hypothetical protein